MAGIDATFAEMQATVAELTKLTATLTGRQTAQIKRLKRLAVVGIIGIALDLMLTVGGIALINRVEDNSNRIGAVEHMQNTVVFCAVYDRLLDNYNPASPSALANPQGYETSTKQIEQGARDLGCAHTTRGIN